MSFFHKKPKEKLPQYVLVSRLPATAGPKLLGRVVLDIENPTDDYRPENPSEVLKNEILEIVDSKFSALLSINKNAAVEAKIGQIFDVTIGGEKSLEKSFEGKNVRTRFLTQHRDALKALLASRRSEITGLLSDAPRGKGYMVVGFKSALDADISTKHGSQRTTKIGVEFPANEVILAASHGAIQTDMASPRARVDFGKGTSHETTAAMDGEQIFAMRYRVITLKRKRDEEMVEYGNVKRVNVEDGVFGPSGEASDPVFDEDELSDSEDGSHDWDDEEFDMSEESIKSDMKKSGCDAVVVESE